MYDRLEEVMKEYDFITAHRGRGLIQGLELDPDKKKAGDVCKKAVENGLIIITAGANIIRFIPPLIISRDDVDKMIDLLKEALS